MFKVKALGITFFILLLGLALPTPAYAQVPDPGAWVEDLAQDIHFAVEGLLYNLLLLHAQMQWFLMRIMAVTGIVLDVVTDFMAEHAFAPLIRQSNSQWGLAVSMSFTIAMLVLGLSYMIAHFIRFQVVEFKSALTWYVVVALFFQLGPELYLSMNSLRSDINSFFYASAVETIHNSGSPLSPLNNNLAQEGVPMLPPCDNFGWLTGQTSSQAGAGVDGIDLGLAYLLATARDVLGLSPPVLGNCLTVNPGGYPPDLPFQWYHTGGYFDRTLAPPLWSALTPEAQAEALPRAMAAQFRLIGAWPLLWLGLFEKLIYLLVTFAQGLSFLAFGVAAIFAFFKRTEALARSVLDLWLEILVTSVIIALGQSLIVSLALAAGATQNPIASIAVALLCDVMMHILLLAALKLVWNALTRLFSAISQATGGAFIPPQQLAAGVAVGTVGAATALATGGGGLALAGAAMSGMSAGGIGGPALGMAGGQLMMAGRMASMSGAGRVMTSGSAGQAQPTPQLEAGENAYKPLLLPSGETNSASSLSENGSPGRGTPVSKATSAPQPVTMAGYEAGELLPDSPAGRRTAPIPAQFTPSLGEATTPASTEPGRAIHTSSGRQPRVASAGGETAARAEVTAQARLNADNERADHALRSALNSDSSRDESAAQAQLDADNGRDDAALRNTLQTTGTDQKITVDTSGLERAGRDLSGAAGALKALADQQHLARVSGQMDVTGGRNVGAVVADAVDIERADRQQRGKPLLEGAGEQFGGRMAQAVGMQPMAGQIPISEAARFNAVGDQALRLGLNGGQVMQVLQEQSQAEDGRSISPTTQDNLVQQVRLTTGTRQSEAQQQVGQFLTVAAALPDEVRITGSIDPKRLKPTEGAN